MRIVEILDEAGDIDLFAGITIVATSIYPQSKVKRERWKYATIARGVAAEMAGGRSLFPKPPESIQPRFITDTLKTISSLYETGTSPRRTFDLGCTLQGTKGHICGGILKMLTILKKHHPEHATIERARWLIATEYEGMKTESGKNYPTTDSSLEKAWAQLRSVAHFHFLFALLGDDHPAFEKDRLLLPVLDEEDRHFVMSVCTLLEDLRIFGEKSEILDARQTWRFPPESLMAEPMPAPQVDPLPDSEIEKLTREFDGAAL